MTAGYHLSSTIATAVAFRIGHCWARNERIGVGWLPLPRMDRMAEYRPPMKAVAFSADIHGAATTRVPIGTRWTSLHQAWRWSTGTKVSSLMSDPTNAVGGRWTSLKRVRDQSNGCVPLRRGREIDSTPWYIWCSLQRGTMKNRMPRSSLLTIKRAMVRAILEMPKRGDDAGMNLIRVR